MNQDNNNKYENRSLEKSMSTNNVPERDKNTGSIKP